jgi:hypothetical protein
VRKLEVSRGVFLLVTPYWEAQTWFVSPRSLPVLGVRRLPFHDALVVVLATGEPPLSLEQLFLVAWRICGGLGESSPCQTGLSGLSRQDGSGPQRTGERAWHSFKAFLHASFVPLHQVSLRDVTVYLTHLFDLGMSWSSIAIHNPPFP